MGYIIKVSCAKMPSSVKAPYKKIALIEVEHGVQSVKMISARARGVKRIIAVWDRRFSGKTANCAASRAIARACEMKAEYEQKELNNHCGIC